MFGLSPDTIRPFSLSASAGNGILHCISYCSPNRGVTMTRFLMSVVALTCWFRLESYAQAVSKVGQTLPVLYEAHDIDTSGSDLRRFIERFDADRGSLNRSYPVRGSAARLNRMRQFYNDWLAELGRRDFDAMSPDGRVDYILMRNHLGHELRQWSCKRSRWQRSSR